MKPIPITHELAVAAGTDAANRRMRAQGRTVWDEDDFSLAAETYRKLMPDPADETPTETPGSGRLWARWVCIRLPAMTNKLEIANQAYESAKSRAQADLLHNIRADPQEAVHQYVQTMAEAEAILRAAFMDALKDGAQRR